MATILSDSDVLIDAMRRREPYSSAVRRIVSAGDLVTSAVSVYELMAGSRSAEEDDQIGRFLDRLPLLELDEMGALAAARVNRILTVAGLRLDAADCLIAGTALANGLPLLTRNVRHFERVPGLEVVTI